MTKHGGAGAKVEQKSAPECDVIMKGGISAGIVYPRAVYHLSGRYKFRRIGGTSAGAIAAVAAAAAEYGRDVDGFAKLEDLPTKLGMDMAALFQPSAPTRAVFHLLLDWLRPKWGPGKKLASSVRRVVAAAPATFIIALLLALFPGVVAAVPAAGLPDDGADWKALIIRIAVWLLPVAFLIALAAAVVRIVLRTLKALPEQGFGICDGHTREPGIATPPLTDWMYEQFQDLAGRDQSGVPLTFGDLWGTKAVAAFNTLRGRDVVMPREWREAAAQRRVDLEVITTNVTLGRPYLFPFRERIFFFCEKRMRDYFPDSVVDHMVDNSRLAMDEQDTVNGRPTVIPMRCTCHDNRVRSLPEPQDLPVVLAARISLSFPILLSALPLFCVDFARGPGKRRLIETWFSDGGISSNFPMHLFDSPLPSRPTFGFNLGPAHADYEGLVWAPREQGRSGRLPRSQEITSVPSFLRAILGSMQNWGDNTRITMPGFRDRVAVIRQKPGEGGMNLAMEAEVIRDLANRGADAAALFDGFNLDLHKWVRYRVSMAATDDLLATLSSSYRDGFGDYLDRYRPEANHFGAHAGDEAATEAVLAAARVLAKEGYPHTGRTVPRPVPEFRTSPRL